MAEIVRMEDEDGSRWDKVAGVPMVGPRDAINFFIAPTGDKHPHDVNTPIGERFITKAELHKWATGHELARDPFIRGGQMKKCDYAMSQAEDWCHEDGRNFLYVSFSLENDGVRQHYYGITKNPDIRALAISYIDIRKQQYLISCDVKLSLIEKSDMTKKLRDDGQRNLKAILEVIHANRKANEKPEAKKGKRDEKGRSKKK